MTTECQPSELDEARFFDVAKSAVHRVPLIRDAIASYFAMLDDATPKWAKATIVAGLAYFACPVDAIPDAIAVFGFTDDAAAIGVMMGTVGSVLKDEHYARARAAFS